MTKRRRNSGEDAGYKFALLSYRKSSAVSLRSIDLSRARSNSGSEESTTLKKRKIV